MAIIKRALTCVKLSNLRSHLQEIEQENHDEKCVTTFIKVEESRTDRNVKNFVLVLDNFDSFIIQFVPFYDSHHLFLQEVKFGQANYDASGNDDGFKVNHIFVNPYFLCCLNNLASKSSLCSNVIPRGEKIDVHVLLHAMNLGLLSNAHLRYT